MAERGDFLRELMKERLNAAAEQIFALFESTVSEFEDEVCRFKEENQRKQQLLDVVLNPSVYIHKPVSFDVEGDGGRRRTPEPVLDTPNKTDVQIQTVGSEEQSFHVKPEPASEETYPHEDPNVRSQQPPESPNMALPPAKRKETATSVNGTKRQRSPARRRERPARKDANGQESEAALRKVKRNLSKGQKIESSDGKSKHVAQRPGTASAKGSNAASRKRVAQRRAQCVKVSSATPANNGTAQDTNNTAATKTNAQDSKEASAQDSKEASAQDPKEASAQDPKEASAQDPKEASAQDPKEASAQDPKEASAQDPKEASAQDSKDPSSDASARVPKRRGRRRTQELRCEPCNRTFLGQRDYLRHKGVHSNWKRPNVRLLKKQDKIQGVLCPFCNEPFRLKKELAVHLHVHAAKPFGCSYCHKRYTTELALHLHTVDQHTGGMPFSCPFCSKGFMRQHDLRVHKRVHTRPKPVITIEYDRKFTQKSRRRHLSAGLEPNKSEDSPNGEMPSTNP